ncbi:MAG: prolyl oligopeptidase family serine peptidase, partial [Balneolales bacterium]
LAFYSAAVDQRIDAVLVSGYFDSRQQVWDEPIYRNVWGLLEEFGDAEIASLIAPRSLVIEHSMLPEDLEESTRKPSGLDEFSYTGYRGSIKTPKFTIVQSEFDRIDELIETGFQSRYLISDEGKPEKFGSETALKSFTRLLDPDSSLSISDEIPVDNRRSFDPEKRQLRQAKEIEDHVQWLLRVSDYERDKFFLHKVMPEFEEREWTTSSYHSYLSPDRFIEKGKEYRTFFWEEILGKFDDPMLPPNPRTRKTYDETRWTGYEVVLDVYDDLLTAGVILIPKDINQSEKRPVVVLQHGRNGVPQALIEGSTSYYNMGAQLADQGFIVYVPYGLFRGEDRYRWLDRKANAVKKTLFTFIISQHDQTLQWLGTLPFVDSDRIAFYGKSYGGEAAMRVPAVLEGYSLSIVSADFGDWTRKVVDTHSPRSFMNTIEWEMPYFNMGSTFSYAEMAYLIFPRPFMVERGRHDAVQPDHWVASEYAKVDHLYNQFNLSDKTEIEFFQGGHASRNVGTFKFLRKHLNWP